MKKILVIEDDLLLHQILAETLETEGFVSFSAYNGKAGIRLARELKPDLIICDIMMPAITGYDVLKSLSGDASTAGIPFIFLSAIAERDKIRYGMELGADDYLTKPFRPEEFIKAVKARLKKQEYLLLRKNMKEERESRNKIEEAGHLFIEIEGQPKLVKVNSIICITAYVDYSYVYLCSGEKILVRRLLKQWENILPERIFIRIHRSTIINLDYIEKVEKMYNHSLAVYLMKNENAFIVSRRFSAYLKSKFHYK